MISSNLLLVLNNNEVLDVLWAICKIVDLIEDDSQYEFP